MYSTQGSTEQVAHQTGRIWSAWKEAFKRNCPFSPEWCRETAEQLVQCEQDHHSPAVRATFSLARYRRRLARSKYSIFSRYSTYLPSSSEFAFARRPNSIRSRFDLLINCTCSQYNYCLHCRMGRYSISRFFQSISSRSGSSHLE